ncbi:hypothetical protein CRG98_000777 [Punica granatum]|uniref:25S rRNA (uridine-N(3))-methyltransferase BMT5-like domain-containing protein n=1 Tax=Punica granatum TaxID=22663 RepID=A0A2I0LDR3_PUNGR|nr:hypothetical protein CRG98_000777 [Punica granatum]
MPKFFNRPSTFNSADSSSEAVISSSLHSIEAAVPQIMQEKLMIMAMQKEEGRRLETSLAQSMEKIVKANRDALWARFQEENVKNKKLLQDRVQQIMAMQKEEGRRLETSLAQSMEKIVKANGDALWARFQEETVTNDKLLQVRVQQRINLLANFINKDLPATIERIVKREVAAVQIDVLRAITPAIEKTIVSAITESFQDVINSASSITHTLNGELAEAQRKLICLAVGGANPSAITPLVTQPSNGPLGKLHEKRRDVSTLYCLLVMLSEAEEKRAREEKKIMHYSSNHNILLVGEGDFSFATCLAQAFGSAPNIVATSLDSRGFFYKEDDLQQIRIHKELVKGFLKSASSMLSYNGQVHITHKTNYPFSAWDIVGLAEEVGLYLLDEDNFKPWMYPGYVNKRGDGHRSDESFLVGLCSTYKFTKL